MWMHAEVNEFVEGDHHRGLRSSTPRHPLATAVRPTDPRPVYLMMCGSWKAVLSSTLVKSKPVAISVSSAAAAACRGVLRLG